MTEWLIKNLFSITEYVSMYVYECLYKNIIYIYIYIYVYVCMYFVMLILIL